MDVVLFIRVTSRWATLTCALLHLDRSTYFMMFHWSNSTKIIYFLNNSHFKILGFCMKIVHFLLLTSKAQLEGPLHQSHVAAPFTALESAQLTYLLTSQFFSQQGKNRSWPGPHSRFISCDLFRVPLRFFNAQRLKLLVIFSNF